MALHPTFPTSPYEILHPSVRWFPAEEELRAQGYAALLPPLVARLREQVYDWRAGGYAGATPTSRALLRWWFEEEHLLPQADGTVAAFRYYFAQREAVETVIFLTDVARVRDHFDLLRYDASGAVSAGMFPETWHRYVLKLATGAGKTKVLSLLLAWAYFHKQYEAGSGLARNFLLIAPNIIVLDRLRADFDGLRIFYQDPVLPDNGFEGRNWRDDFQLTLHVQDNVRVTQPTGNLFLTNIHRVYDSARPAPSADDDDASDFFLGTRPTGATTDSKVDLGMIVRDISELVILNDEAHHIHDERMAWFQSIQDIHHRLVQKGSGLAMQLDVTATPRHNSGGIFVRTISDYPLVEAIHQNVVKHPVIPDEASRAKLIKRNSSTFTEAYADFLHLGYLEWQRASEEHQRMGKKAVLFVMTDDTKNCDEVAQWLEDRYAELAGAVLVIHTKANGDISESASGKGKEELETLRRAANELDRPDSPYKAIVSVLMLKEGWDVRNVTTIVGLRAYSAKSNILPEQTLGRGLRRMYPLADGVAEYVSIIGTDTFMDFVQSIKSEGVELEQSAMGAGAGKPKGPLVVEVDRENAQKDLDALDIELPILTPRLYREYRNLAELTGPALACEPVPYRTYTSDEQREIVFRHIVHADEAAGSDAVVHHSTLLDGDGEPDYRSALGFYTKTILREARLSSGYDVLYGHVKQFVRNQLFGRRVDLETLDTLSNLSEPATTERLTSTFKRAINALTIRDKGDARIERTIKLSQVRPFVVKDQPYLPSRRSVFNRVIGDGGFELEFAAFLEGCEDVQSYAKNYLAVGYRLDYQKANGELSHYIPDFFVKTSETEVWIVETKGREELDLPHKLRRLVQWCDDVAAAGSAITYHPLYVPQETWEKHKGKLRRFADVSALFSTSLRAIIESTSSTHG